MKYISDASKDIEELKSSIIKIDATTSEQEAEAKMQEYY
jgi:hypothetical protein